MITKPYLKIVILFLAMTSVYAQKRIPDVFIEDLQRQRVSASQILNADGPTIVSFWATWCKPCLRELQAVNAELKEWKKKVNVKLVAISTDDARTQRRVLAFVKSKKWSFDVYIDPNGDLQRSMNILSIPHTIILNKSGEMIYRHSAYAMGDEAKYFEVLKGL
jgi:peroxiredoxin